MRKIKGDYTKQNGYKRLVDVVILEETDKHFKGLDLSKLTIREKELLLEAINEYEKRISTLVKKSFRTFIKTSFDHTTVVIESTFDRVQEVKDDD